MLSESTGVTRERTLTQCIDAVPRQRKLTVKVRRLTTWETGVPETCPIFQHVLKMAGSGKIPQPQTVTSCVQEATESNVAVSRTAIFFKRKRANAFLPGLGVSSWPILVRAQGIPLMFHINFENFILH